MPVTKDQAIVAVEFHYGTCQNHIGIHGGKTLQQIRFRRNGKTKTWVRSPLEFRIPVKRGLREYGYITQTNAQDFHTAEQCEIVEVFPTIGNGAKVKYPSKTNVANLFTDVLKTGRGGWFPPR